MRPAFDKTVLTVLNHRARVVIAQVVGGRRLAVTCDACGAEFNPLSVPCGTIFCASCWSRVAVAFELPVGTVRCWTEGACTASGGPSSAYAGLQRQIGRLVGLYGGDRAAARRKGVA